MSYAGVWRGQTRLDVDAFLMKAKELRPFAERLITLSKREEDAKWIDSGTVRYAGAEDGLDEWGIGGHVRRHHQDVIWLDIAAGGVEQVEQVSFSGKSAIERGQEVYYVTERAVFTLTPDGVMLLEIAPGLDLQKDVLDMMDFRPNISPALKTIDKIIYRDELLGLKHSFEELRQQRL